MNKPQITDFHLRKVKLLKNEGLNIVYDVYIDEIISYDVDYPNIPHADLMTMIKLLKNYLAMYYDYGDHDMG